MLIEKDIPPAPEHVVAAFTSRAILTVVLVFIDIARFSITTRGMNGGAMLDFVEAYYKTVIPKIYQHHGEVEKVMGDGIIAVFGPPFGDGGDSALRDAEDCCGEVIDLLHDSNKAVKCALHQGDVVYYPLSVDGYTEATMVGEAITELYRLESVAKKNAIAFYADTRYEQLKERDIEGFKRRGGGRAEWIVTKGTAVQLPGVGFDSVRYRKLNV